jgi:AcrR family transcriptional regulator
MTSSADLRPQARPGLRERKKARTRSTIRSEAIRLFSDRGYTETTVEQIADAAEVSPSTFFRYFPTKEAVIITDEWDSVIVEAFRAQPPDVTPVRALRNASRVAFQGLTPAERHQEQLRQELVLRTPELQTALLANYANSIDMMAGLIAEREGGDPADLRIRSLAGALAGVAMSVTMQFMRGESARSEPVAQIVERVDAALALLEQGFT